MKPFEIFRAGRHTSSQGTELSFSDGDLSDIVASYDPALHHAPIVVGHPKQDAPAYGWVDGLAVKGSRLVATPADVDPAFADLVQTGKYRKVSAAFYGPAAPNNPTPGRYYLRHVGFLGAAAPAVKGLKPIEFAGAEDGIVEIEFADGWKTAWAIETAARLFRGLRDHFIATSDLETADRLLPDWDITQLQQQAADLRAEDAAPAYSETERQEEPTMTQTPPDAAALQARADDLARREAAFAERERASRNAEDAAFVDGVVKAGRLPVGLQAAATALFSDLGDDELTFSEGGEERKTTPRAAFRDLLGKLPVPVVTAELAGGAGPDFSDPAAVAAAITTEVRAAAEKGETISPADAWTRLSTRRSA